jgi:hypothetical protein
LRPAGALGLVALLFVACHSTSQVPDFRYEPTVEFASYPARSGPRVLIDEAHSNYHTVDGRYAPFAAQLRADGYIVEGLAAPATPETLGTGDIYVISNALAASDVEGWKLPIESAFTAAEIRAIEEWVELGGSLMLIADHMPMPGAVEDLAAVFGILFHNGFLYDATGESKLNFERGQGLGDHAITTGRSPDERVDKVRTFTGQAFRATGEVAPLLTVPPGSILKLPIEAWEFKPTTPEIRADGMMQGAVLHFGKGRVAVFGEAAMFSAQEQIRDGKHVQMGMNAPDAAQNPQFLLNVMHGLSGLLD